MFMGKRKMKQKMQRKIAAIKRRTIRTKMGKYVFLNLCRTPNPLKGLSNKYLYKANLYKVLYKGGKFNNVRWNASNITHCSFKNAKCSGVDFFNCNLKNTSFQNSTLENVVFFNCNLKDVNFKGATFKRVIFISTNIKNAKNLILTDGCIIYKSYPKITIDKEISQNIFELYDFPEFNKYNVLFVSKRKLNLWILKILIDLYGDDALRALIALKYRKSKWGFFTVFSFMQHIERYLKV